MEILKEMQHHRILPSVIHSDPLPQSENQSETNQNSVRNQDEINTNAAAVAAASAVPTVITTAKAVVKT